MDESKSLDELARYNKERWDELARAGVEYARPWLDLEAGTARHLIDPHGVMGDVAGRDVLCLAAAGGQQSVAFAMLGAHVTVFDLSTAQLEQDRLTAARHGLSVLTVEGDMRDLSRFGLSSFDIVYQAFSINFVPDVRPVHAQVARIIRPDGIYRLEWSNPFTQTVDDTGWTGEGYLLRHPYEDGRELSEIFPHWEVPDADGNVRRLMGPKEFVHALSTMVNSLAEHDFTIVHASEDCGDDPLAEPGSWPHYQSIAVPYLTFWCRYTPDRDRPA